MHKTRRPGCPAPCPACPSSDEPKEGLNEWVAAHAEAAGDPLGGAKLLGRSACAFLLPVAGALAGALAGAIVAGGNQSRRFAGMAIGLCAGLTASILVSILSATRKRHRRHNGREAE